MDELQDIATVEQGFEIIRGGSAGKALLVLRTKKGWSQGELARRVGCKPSYISHLENGRPMSAKMARKLIAVFSGVD